MSEPADTTRAMLSCAAGLLAEASFEDISYKQLGEAVGVSERTVYRHFPTRSHFLSELALWVENQRFRPSAFTTWGGFFEAVALRFFAFDAAPAEAFVLARAASTSPLRASQSSFFAEAVTALVEDSSPALNLRDRRRNVSALCYFASAQYWARCRVGFGMNGLETGEAFRRAVNEILAVAPRGTWPRAAMQEIP